MQKGLDIFQKLNVQIVGVSYDSVEVLKAFAEAGKVTFPLLSDPKSEAIIAYSLKNKETVGKRYGKIDLDGVPYPGTVVVDANGKIVAKLFVDGYQKRHSPKELVEAIRALNK